VLEVAESGYPRVASALAHALEERAASGARPLRVLSLCMWLKADVVGRMLRSPACGALEVLSLRHDFDNRSEADERVIVQSLVEWVGAGGGANLRELRLAGVCAVMDGLMCALQAHAPRLRVLALTVACVTQKGIRALARMEQLEGLAAAMTGWHELRGIAQDGMR
jgi:hypothetical protein